MTKPNNDVKEAMASIGYVVADEYSKQHKISVGYRIRLGAQQHTDPAQKGSK